MSEATDLPASTIHRLLGLNGREMPTELNAKDLEGSLSVSYTHLDVYKRQSYNRSKY